MVQGLISMDQHIFHVMLMMTSVFLIMFVFGTSMPAWYVIQEPVTNLSRCVHADRYVDDVTLRSWPTGQTYVKLTSSLWYLSVSLQHSNKETSMFLPFLFARQNVPLEERLENDFLPDMTLPRSLIAMFTFTFLALGAGSAILASNRPSRQIYYGLSGIFLISGTSTWVSIAVPTSQELIINTAVDFCMKEGLLRSSIFLQVLTLACAVLAFLLASILIHMAVMRNHVINQQREHEIDRHSSKYNLVAEEAYETYSANPYSKKLIEL